MPAIPIAKRVRASNLVVWGAGSRTRPEPRRSRDCLRLRRARHAEWAFQDRLP